MRPDGGRYGDRSVRGTGGIGLSVPWGGSGGSVCVSGERRGPVCLCGGGALSVCLSSVGGVARRDLSVCLSVQRAGGMGEPV